MKIQIIHLESHDDTNSVKDKMDWSQTPRVLLIWPEKSNVLAERLDLILLERHSTAMGSQLALVTTQPNVINHAKEAGIPVFPSKQKAQSAPWTRSHRYYRRRSIQKSLPERANHTIPDRPQTEPLIALPQWAEMTVFTVGVFAVLFIATLFLPQAEITIPPQDQWQEMTIPVRASPDVQSVHVSGTIPIHVVPVSIEKRAKNPATGTLAIPDTHAAGNVLITNLTDHQVTLPQNTILTVTNPFTVRYQTLAEAFIPAGSGEQVEVPIKSLKPGVKSNQPAHAEWGISAKIGADLKAENPQPITGGRDVYVSAPTARDRQSLEGKVIDELEETSLSRIKQKLKQGDILLSESPNLEEVEEKRFTPEEGEPGETLEMTIRVQFSAWVIEHEDLVALAREVILTSQRSSTSQPDLESLTLEHQPPPPLSSTGEATWQLTLKWRQDPVVEHKDILPLALGQTPTRAKKRIGQEFNLKNPAQINTHPSWWPRLPFIPFRIDVQ